MLSQESLAFIFEMAHLHEDALREYDELELCYLETVNMPGKQRDFGGFDGEDDQAVLLKPGSKPLTQIVQDDSFREFEFRQYLFACQSRVGAHKRHHIDHSVLFSFQNCSFTFTTFSLAYLYVVLCSCCSS
jgi:ABC-type cobalt transport system substrate-binding protein